MIERDVNTPRDAYTEPSEQGFGAFGQEGGDAMATQALHRQEASKAPDLLPSFGIGPVARLVLYERRLRCRGDTRSQDFADGRLALADQGSQTLRIAHRRL